MFFSGLSFRFSFCTVPQHSARFMGSGYALTAVVLLLVSGCGTTQNLTLQGQLSELQNQKTALQNERDAWKDRYTQLQESSRAQTQALASSAQENQALKKNQMVYQEQLRDMLTRAEKAEKENQQLQERLAKLNGGTGTGSMSDLADTSAPSGTSSPQMVAIPNIEGVTMRDTPDTFHIELPTSEIFDSRGGISAKGRMTLQKVAQAVDQTFRGAKIDIQGHTSPFRKAGVNTDPVKTSMSYANIVRDFFINENLLPPEALKASAHGATQPVLQNVNGQDSNYRNSRVELVVIKPKF